MAMLLLRVLGGLVLMQFFKSAEDSFSSGIDPDRREIAPADDAVAIDNKKRALRRPVPRAICTIGRGNSSLGLKIREQRKSELAVVREGQMTPDPIDRDTYQLCVEALKLGKNFV